jgi:hypothetical protein
MILSGKQNNRKTGRSAAFSVALILKGGQE